MKRLLFLLALLIASPAWATTYWTSPSAVSTTLSSCDGDADPGSYCTFASIYAGMAGGDTLKGKAGTYDTRITTAPKVGPSSTQKTTITCETVADPPNGVAPVCIMKPVGAFSTVVLFSSSQNWSFQNWKFDLGGSTNSTVSCNFGVSNDTLNDNWELINNEFTSQGETATTSIAMICMQRNPNGTIRNNHIHHCATASANPDCHGIYFSGSNATIENNLIHDIGRSGGNAYGIQYYSSSGIAFTGGVIRFNRVYTANRCILVGASNTSAEVYGNLCYDIAGSGITARQTSGKVYNNTIDATSTAIVVENNCSAAGCTVRNNISTTGMTLGSSTASNNSASVTDTTHFIDPNNATMASRNYNLIETAPAGIADGVITGLPSGYTCVATAGTACDRGAYQAPVRSGAVVEDTDKNTYVITLSLASQSVRSGTGLQGATTANFTLRDDGAAKTESASTIIGTSTVTVDVSDGDFTAGVIDDAYARGTLTDNVNIGGTYAYVRSWSATAGTNNIGAAPAGAYEVVHYRCLSWYSDTSPASTDWLRAEDAATTTLACPLRPGGLGAVAVALARNTDDVPSQSFEWHANRNAGAYSALTNTTSATAIAFAGANAPSMSDGANIASAILTNPHATYVATGSQVVAQQASQPTIDFEADSTANIILLVKSDAASTVGDTYCLQPALTGQAVSSITQTKTPCFQITYPSSGM